MKTYQLTYQVWQRASNTYAQPVVFSTEADDEQEAMIAFKLFLIDKFGHDRAIWSSLHEVQPEPPMPIHDHIEAMGQTRTVHALLDFVGTLNEEYALYKLDSGNIFNEMSTQEKRGKLVFGFLGYDYDAWIAEQNAHMAWIQSQISESPK